METFSIREKKIIDIIGRKKMTLDQITSELFKESDKPFEPKIVVGNSIRRIIRKCTYHNLTWTLIKTRENNKLLIKKKKV